MERGEIRLGDVSIDYLVVRHKRQRTLRLSLQDDGVVRVSTPWRYPRREVTQVLREHADWIIRERERRAESSASRRTAVGSGAFTALFLGERYNVHIRRAGVNHGIQWSEAGFDAEIPEGLDSTAELDVLADLFRQWYAAKALRHLPPRIHEQAASMGVHVNRITIRNQRTRWGSCSARGNLNFSLRLMMMPVGVIDHIIIHELAHLSELNHSPAFWAIVQRHDPHTAVHRRWLRQHGRELDFP